MDNREITVEAVTHAGNLSHLEVNATHSPRGILIKIDHGPGPKGGATYAYVDGGRRAKVHADGRVEPVQMGSGPIGYEEFIELGGEG